MHFAAQDIVDSDAAFREHFHRDGALFHRGDPTPVPTGGSRIPEGLNGDWKSLPIQPPPQEETDPTVYGDEYCRLSSARADLKDLKTMLLGLSPIVDAITLLRCDLVKSVEKGDADAASAIESQIANRVMGLDGEIRSIEEFSSRFVPSEDFPSVRSCVEEVAKMSRVEYATMAQYRNYAGAITAITRPIFSCQQLLLRRMKDIKRAKAA